MFSLKGLIMKRFLTMTLSFCLLYTSWAPVHADEDEPATAKEGLQALQEFIGDWKASGGPVVGTQGIWSEKVQWGWRFKGDDVWLTVNFDGGKLYNKGEMRYLVDRKVYQFTVTNPDGKKLVFEGPLKRSVLTLEYTDPETTVTTQMVMNTAAEGVRFIYRINSKKGRATIWRKDFLVQATREGETLGAKEKKNECVVTGGVGTSTVSYKGATYYVCCSGCRDAFNEDPEKYIKEFEARKKKQ